MSQHIKRILLCNVFSLAISMSAIDSIAQENRRITEPPTFPPNLLQEKLEYYRALYPDILFLVLKGGDELLDDMMALDLILGHQPKSLDYEQPPELREDLMFVSVERIILMLQHQEPSASLFKADKPRGWQEHVCVLTIDQQMIAADSIRSTQHLLNLPEKVIKIIPRDLQLMPRDYLEFVIDHEVYHCLKSMYVGPQRRSHKEFWAEYNHFLDEQGADAYALGMHIKTRGRETSYAKNILRIRGMSLYNADPDHMTCKAMEKVLKIPIENITAMNAKQIFELANKIKDSQKISYKEYLLYLASAIQAIQELGKEALLSEELRNRIKDIQAEPTMVKELVTNSRRCLTQLMNVD